ncbi:hypothetical protein M1D30_05060 [Prevotella sp. E15-22]|jgi:hypothetical protein|uniref:hypothetical protein n=1 Tax=Prevotella sp. E15-22 TaxID=2937774 RepID=UPI00205281BC|nr:hypothetical protein [Prevotella sp. E15-22]UPS45540.1 hypothetical protein M1D30_05060 [Prevotella sp. E15-22]
MKQENDLLSKMNQFWQSLQRANDELNSFITSGMPTTTEKRHKDFVRQWNHMKDKATDLCDLIEQQQSSDIEPKEVTLPWDSSSFKKAWQDWKEYLEEQHNRRMKSRMEYAALAYLKKLSAGNEATAVEYLQFAMAGGYTKFFKVTEKSYEQPTVAGGRGDGDY